MKPKQKTNLEFRAFGFSILSLFVIWGLVFGILPVSQANAAAPTNGLIGYWAFEEQSGTTAGDSSGNGNNGTLTNGPTWVTGKVGSGALSFDGINSYVSMGNTNDAPPTFTLSSWVNHAIPQTNVGVVGKHTAGNGYYFSTFYNSVTGARKIQLVINGTTISSNASFPEGAWTHVLGMFDGTNASIYINGVLDKTLAVSAPNSTSANFFVGAQNTTRFSGLIDEVRMYNRALSAQEILDVYNDTGSGGFPPPPPPPPDITPPVISGISSSAITQTGATISWTTDEPSDTQIDYGLTTGYGNSSALNSALVSSHSAAISGLSAATAHNYRVKSRDAAGNLAISSNNIFTTSAVSPPPTPPPTPPPPPPPTGNVIPAASCENKPGQTDVQNAINSAQDGYIIQVPAGSCTWTTKVTILSTKGVTLQGAGMGQTIITDSVGGAFFTLSSGAGKSYRVTGFEFIGTNAYDFEVAGQSSAVRIDNIKFNNQGMRWTNALGVVDNNRFELNSSDPYAISISHPNWQGIGLRGHNSWAQPTGFGTSNFVFMEDNYFIGTPKLHVTDGDSGGRMVFRHNNVVNGIVGWHGADSSGWNRGFRAAEIYGNTFTNSAQNIKVFQIRSGTGAIYNNNIQGHSEFATLNNYRSTGDGAGRWGACSGLGSYDDNDPYGVFITGTHTASGTGSETLTDSSKSWTANQWA